jgi:hypothetical protein
MLNEEYVPFPPSVQHTADETSVRTDCVSLATTETVRLYFVSLKVLIFKCDGCLTYVTVFD